MAKQETKKATKKATKKLTKKLAKKLAKKTRKKAGKKATARTTAKAYTTRSDLGAPASVALDRMPKPLRDIGYAADRAIRSLSKDIEARVSWGHAGYKVEGHDLFAISEKRAYVNVYFGNGASLAEHDTAHLLEGSGKMLRHVKLHHVEEAESGSFVALLASSFDLAKRGSGSAYAMKKKA